MLISDNFLKFTVNICKKTSIKNNLNQVIETYVIDKPLKVNIQPVSEKDMRFVWGSETVNSLNMYSKIDIPFDTVIFFSDKYYKVINKRNWFDYVQLLIEEYHVN